MPSMVVTLEPAAWPASTVQDLTARPSIWTTQAPHWLVSQPTWVPVRLRFSRSRWTRRVRSSTSAETALPFTVNLMVDTRDTSRCFIVIPIRNSGDETCNRDFGRASHCDDIRHARGVVAHVHRPSLEHRSAYRPNEEGCCDARPRLRWTVLSEDARPLNMGQRRKYRSGPRNPGGDQVQIYPPLSILP